MKEHAHLTKPPLMLIKKSFKKLKTAMNEINFFNLQMSKLENVTSVYFYLTLHLNCVAIPGNRVCLSSCASTGLSKLFSQPYRNIFAVKRQAV